MMVPKVRVELTRPFGQWFLSSSLLVRHCLQGITNVHVLARLQIGRPRQWTSAMYWQTPANIKATGGRTGGRFVALVYMCSVFVSMLSVLVIALVRCVVGVGGMAYEYWCVYRCPPVTILFLQKGF